jgi:serine/threonine protein kinase/Tol biopolymer transport system component
MSADQPSPLSEPPAEGVEGISDPVSKATSPHEDSAASNENAAAADASSPPRGDGGSTAAQNSRHSNQLGPDIAHYHLEEKIGGGALTAVYRARDTVLTRLVALKVLLPGADQTIRERFRREAQTAAMLEHPNIVRTYQVGTAPDEGLSFIAMELVQGPSLAEALEETPAMSAADSAAVLEPIARALAYAHERGVVHRDVKPSNILLQSVDPDHPLRVQADVGAGAVAPLLSDFGIARALDAPELTSEGRTIGTPAFMSPEQCSGRDDLDGRADIYSLGAVLYRCVVGRPPYVGSTTQILHAHVYDPLTIPDDAMRRLPPLCTDILRRALAKAPKDRYVNAADMAKDLAQLANSGVMGPPSTPNDELEETIEMPASMAPSTGKSGTSSHVLVPARTTRVSESTATESSIKPTTTRLAVPPAKLRRQKILTRLGAVMLALALIALVGMLGYTLFTGVLPVISDGGQDLAGGAATPEADGSAIGDTAAVEQGQPPATGQPPQDGAETGVGGGGQSTPAPGASGQLDETPSPTQVGTLQVEPAFAWRNASELFEERDWSGAREWLIAVRRADPDFDAAVVSTMLAEADVWLALEAMNEDDFSQASELLSEAVEMAPQTRAYDALRESVDDLVDAGPNADVDRRVALLGMRRALVSYAAFLADEERYCDALEPIEVAEALISGDGPLDVREEYAVQCEAEATASALVPPIGRILFSAVEGEAYGVYDVDVAGASSPRLLIDQASQPSLSPDGSRIAFHSRRPDIQGLTLTSVPVGADLGADRIRVTSYVEDARDAAPSWNPQGDRLAYGSKNFGDERSRIYLTWADGNRDTVELGLGKDPAWHPVQDLIVYNGTDETGNNPGLWLMRTDGTERVRLTDNGNDQRPVWLPDGSGIVFMSSGRDGNWELYRVDLQSRAVTRLTQNIAQDGLPAVSPDGQYVGFMTDRQGYWSLWYVPVQGGEALPLAEIDHALPKWLEHSTQWVR